MHDRHRAATRVAAGSASALVLFVAVQTIWDQLFSPFYTESIAVLMLAVALTAVRGVRLHRAPSRPRRDQGVNLQPGPTTRPRETQYHCSDKASDDHDTQKDRRPVPVRRRHPLDDRPR